MDTGRFLFNAFRMSTPQLVAILVSAAVFIIAIFIGVIHDEIQRKRYETDPTKNEWLFTRWDEKLYDTLTKTEPEAFLKKLGFELIPYRNNCNLIKKDHPNYKKLAAGKIIGIFLMFVSLVVFAVSGTDGLAFTLILLVIGYYYYEGDAPRIKKEAINRRKQLARELPRFLDLLQTALFVNLPISEAIVITSNYLNGTIISEELLLSMADSKLGTRGWQEALQDIAIKYEVDTFSDFVQYLITGFDKGVPIYDIVCRQAEEVRKVSLLTSEEEANKLTSSILVPVAIFELLPLILLVGFPLVIQFTTVGGLGFL